MNALPGEHYCIRHQGNTSHYDERNCTVCRLERELAEAQAEVTQLRERLDRILTDYGRNVLSYELLKAEVMCLRKQAEIDTARFKEIQVTGERLEAELARLREQSKFDSKVVGVGMGKQLELQAEVTRLQNEVNVANDAVANWTAHAKRVHLELARLREELDWVYREATGALNNAFPDEAPDILEHIGSRARAALAGKEQT